MIKFLWAVYCIFVFKATIIDLNVIKGLKEFFHTSTKKKILGDLLFSIARDWSLIQDSDLPLEKKLLRILKQFVQEEVILNSLEYEMKS